MALLVAIPYSPWSEKARWALDHHGIAYREVEHVPLIGEARLRWLAKRPLGKVSAPLLLTDDGEVVLDSFVIARWADEHGKAPKLVPEGTDAEVAAWNARVEDLSRAGRALVVRRTAEDADAKREALPPFVPAAARGSMTALADLGTAFLARKYATDEGGLGTDPGCERAMRAELLEARRALAGGRSYLLGAFTLADVALAAALQFVRPVGSSYVPLGPATARVWETPTLAAEFADLLSWRDRIYEKHRRPVRGA